MNDQFALIVGKMALEHWLIIQRLTDDLREALKREEFLREELKKCNGQDSKVSA